MPPPDQDRHGQSWVQAHMECGGLFTLSLEGAPPSTVAAAPPTAARPEASALTGGDHKVVKPKLKPPVNKPLKPDAPKHPFQGCNRNPFLMLVALHLRADQPQPPQDPQNRIDHPRRPSQYQRPPGRKQPIRLTQHGLRLHQMLEHRQHYHMIELP